MAAPVYSDITPYPGANGTPTNDTDPWGGAIDTSAPWLTASLNSVMSTIFTSGADTTYNCGFYFKMTNAATGSLVTARVYNRAGAQLNVASGTLQYLSTSNSDTGIIRTTGKVGGVWVQDDVTLTGTTPVTGTKVWDTTSVVRHESLSAGLIPAKMTGNVTISCSGQILCVVYGTAANPKSQDLAVMMCSSEWRLALVTAINTDFTFGTNNRRNMPSNSGGYELATLWTGADTAVPVPGGVLAADDYIGVTGEFTAFTGIPTPVTNYTEWMPLLLGTPQ